MTDVRSAYAVCIYVRAMLHNITHIRETDSDISPFIEHAVDVLYSVYVSDIDQCRQATGTGDTRLTSQGNEQT